MEIARDTAKIIIEDSWESSRIRDVLLYGSTLRSGVPEDIDLLIIHGGLKFGSFSLPNSDIPSKDLRLDRPVGEDNPRDYSSVILSNCGYKEGREFMEDNVYKKLERLLEERYGFIYPDSSLVDDLFDVNILSTKILDVNASDDDLMDHVWDWGTHKDISYNARERAIESCRDPTFWHTILSGGRIYDMDKQDFTIGVEEKYPGALDLFPS